MGNLIRANTNDQALQVVEQKVMKWHKSIGLEGRTVVPGSYWCVKEDLPGLGMSVWRAQRWRCGFPLVPNATFTWMQPLHGCAGHGLLTGNGDPGPSSLPWPQALLSKRLSGDEPRERHGGVRKGKAGRTKAWHRWKGNNLGKKWLCMSVVQEEVK